MSQKVEINGEEVEVFTAAEVQERETTVRTAVEGEWKPKVDTLESDLKGAKTALATRANEFAQFRKLSDEQVAKLGDAERTIYENQLSLAEKDEKIAESDKRVYEGNVTSAIRAKVGNDQKLFDKVRDMYKIINLEDLTPEQIATRVNAAVGAIGQTEPDLLAAAGFSMGGGFEPPKAKEEGQKSYADTEEGKAAAAALGIILEAPKQ